MGYRRDGSSYVSDSRVPTKFNCKVEMKNPQRIQTIVIQADNVQTAKGMAEGYGRLIGIPTPASHMDY